MSIPQHVAVIPDGNRRWAKAQSLNPWDGHSEGAKRFWDIGDHAYKAGVTHITFWGASYGNLTKRNPLEIKFLIELFKNELSKPDILERLIKNEVRLQVLGEWRDLLKSESFAGIVDSLQDQTKHFEGKKLTILFGYDGQREMLAAINGLIESGLSVTEELLRQQLWTGTLPDVDLVIRTGGEPHWSAGFMMWQTANSQFYFTETLWPDFKEAQLDAALADYSKMERRLGK